MELSGDRTHYQTQDQQVYGPAIWCRTLVIVTLLHDQGTPIKQP